MDQIKGIRYVRLNPAGNLTCLVLDAVSREERPQVTAALMDRCEQVGYLLEPEDGRAQARLEMMGGEFCGNASMGTAVFLAARAGMTVGEHRSLWLEVSGAEGLVSCEVAQTAEGWQGSVEMPLPREIRSVELAGRSLAAVFMPGILHVIVPDAGMERAEAEALMETIATRFPEESAWGLMQLEEEAGVLTPLVRVRDSGTQVWESACGSGTSAVAADLASRGRETSAITLRQPGGILRAEAQWSANRVTRIRLSGMVDISPPEVL